MPRALIMSAAMLALAGCASTDLSDFRAAVAFDGRTVVKLGELPLRSGQIIFREQPTAASLFLSLTTQRFSPYTHVGLVSVEEDGVFVYESMGAMLPLPWRRPNEGVGGGVLRTTLKRFVARGGIVAIHEPPAGVDRNELMTFARRQWRDRKPFDAEFDPRDDSRYYCVEFVVRALEAAGAERIEPAPVTRNPSVRVALDWLGIHTPELLVAGDLAGGTRRVALLSRDWDERQVAQFFALRREIHARFTNDQRLGHVMLWKWQQLHLRPPVRRYFDTGIATGEDPARLADRIFGGD